MPTSVLLETRPNIKGKAKSPYEAIMREFNESRKERCKYAETTNLDIPEVDLDEKTFCTESSYEGRWNIFGMNGYGSYTCPAGTTYDGRINDGQFHGRGELTFPTGDSVAGKWENGELTSGEYYFDNGLLYEEDDWPYCRMPDRRYFIEVEKDIQPVNQSYKTAEQPTRAIPDGYFDTGDGYFNPLTKAIHKYNDLTEIMRTPQQAEVKWIMDNCRKAPDSSVGPIPGLYEAFYQSTKYVDEDSSESDLEWLTACDDEFIIRFTSMRRKSSRPIDAIFGQARSTLDAQRFFNTGDSDDDFSMVSRASRKFSAMSSKATSIFDKRSKFFM